MARPIARCCVDRHHENCEGRLSRTDLRQACGRGNRVVEGGSIQRYLPSNRSVLPSLAYPGWILVNDERDTLCATTLKTLRENGLADGVVEFKSGKEITHQFEMLDGPMEGITGYFNPASVSAMQAYLMRGLGKCSTSHLQSCLCCPKSWCHILFWGSRGSNFITLRQYRHKNIRCYNEIRRYFVR